MSNQVYKNLDANVPYIGEPYTFAVTLTGAPGGSQISATCTVKRVSVNQAQMNLTILAGALWASATALSSPVGAIPVSYRPAIQVGQAIIWANPPPITLIYPGSILVGADGRFTFNMIADFNGGSKVFPDLTYPMSTTLTWPITP